MTFTNENGIKYPETWISDLLFLIDMIEHKQTLILLIIDFRKLYIVLMLNFDFLRNILITKNLIIFYEKKQKTEII